MTQNSKFVSRKNIIVALVMAFLLFFFDSLFQQWMTEFLFQQISSQKGVNLWIWFPVLGSVLFSVALNLVLGGLILAALKFRKRNDQTSLLQFFASRLNLLFIESLRALGKTFSWSFLFIFPGLYKWVCYTFVPFVVMFDPDYQSGRVDALESSTQKVRFSFWKISLILTGFSVVVPLLFLSLDDYSVFWNTPLESLCLHIFKFGLTVLMASLLFRIWEKKNGTDVQLERN